MDSSLLVRFLLILVAAFVLFALVRLYNKSKGHAHEGFEQSGAYPDAVGAGFMAGAGKGAPKEPLGNEPLDNEDYTPVDYEVTDKVPADCFPKDRLTAEDLLPKDAANSKWSQVSPAGQGDVKDQNYLSSGALNGLDTQGSSMRNANLQLRPDPICPQVVVSPWSMSTIEPDTSRKSLC